MDIKLVVGMASIVVDWKVHQLVWLLAVWLEKMKIAQKAEKMAHW